MIRKLLWACCIAWCCIFLFAMLAGCGGGDAEEKPQPPTIKAVK